MSALPTIRRNGPGSAETKFVAGQPAPSLLVGLRIAPAAVARWMSFVIISLTVANLFALYLFYRFPDNNFQKIILRMFHVGEDSNLPTLFSVMILLGASVLLYVLHLDARNQGNLYMQRRWLVLSGIFLFLCIDEGAMIHDFLSSGIRNRMPVSIPTFLWIAWVIPYCLFALGVGLYFIGFLQKLPARTRLLFVVAGALYVLGAAGFEMLEAEQMMTGIKDLKEHLLEIVEEVLEMGSIVLFNYALLQYMHQRRVAVLATIENSESSAITSTGTAGVSGNAVKADIAQTRY